MTLRPTLALLVAILAGYAAWLSVVARSSASDEASIRPVSIPELCTRILTGRPPVFVDVREPEEYAEEHLPGALHMPVREMSERARAEIRGDELVVPYCLKDFRGFDGARRLTELGFADVRVMQRVGINGWKAAGLPTAGAVPGRSDAETRSELRELCRRSE
jgi:rhodanese-related sulfurtransferase